MGKAAVIPIGRAASTREKLVSATGRVLARQGFSGLDETVVADEAGLPRRLVFSVFGGLPGLLREFSSCEEFWPSSRELIGDRADELAAMSPQAQISHFFKRFLAALRSRPQTLDILAWETLERNRHSKILEEIRVRTALEYFEHLSGDIPDEVDLSVVVALLAGAAYFVALRSRHCSHFGGVDLDSEAGLRRLENGFDMLMRGVLEPVESGRPDAPGDPGE
jgi:AcrR family transcriptional regulator